MSQQICKTIHVIISGLVQGVYYRAWTQRTAKQLGVNGWVRNLSNGDVEAVFSGGRNIVDEMVKNCYEGSSASDVTNIQIQEIGITTVKGFEIRPTK